MARSTICSTTAHTGSIGLAAALLLPLILVMVVRSCSAFLPTPQSPPVRRRRRRFRGFIQAEGISTAPAQALPLSIISSFQAFASPSPAVRDSLPSPPFLSSKSSIQQASDELVALLLARRSRSGNESSSGGDDARISTLVEILTSAKTEFDPTVCLNGPLYVSSVLEGPAPLWERFGIQLGEGRNRSKRRNLQGQQYKYSTEDKRVVNYAEVFGKAFHVRAYGTYEQDKRDDTVVADANADSSDTRTSTSPLGGILSFFGGGDTQSKRSPSNNLIQCPADFTVTVSKGSFYVLGSLRLDIPISGTGYLRVLYADPNIRLFVSPKSTTDDRWEKAGLKVAQVRVDLVEENGFENLLAE